MKRDKNIQKFFADNRPQVDSGRQFMESLRSQIDLLPTPASLTQKEDILKAERLRSLHVREKASTRRSIFMGVGIALAVTGIAVLLYFIVFAGPDAIVNSDVLASLDTLANSEAASLMDKSASAGLELPQIPQIHIAGISVYMLFSLVIAAATVLICIPVFSKDDII